MPPGRMIEQVGLKWVPTSVGGKQCISVSTDQPQLSQHPARQAMAAMAAMVAISARLHRRRAGLPPKAGNPPGTASPPHLIYTPPRLPFSH
jgi:hypothetical protein